MAGRSDSPATSPEAAARVTAAVAAAEMNLILVTGYWCGEEERKRSKVGQR
jgi:hypothetical protein